MIRFISVPPLLLGVILALLFLAGSLCLLLFGLQAVVEDGLHFDEAAAYESDTDTAKADTPECREIVNYHRNDADQDEINAVYDVQISVNVHQVLCCGLTGTKTLDITAVFFDLLGNIERIELHEREKVRKHYDQYYEQRQECDLLNEILEPLCNGAVRTGYYHCDDDRRDQKNYESVDNRCCSGLGYLERQDLVLHAVLLHADCSLGEDNAELLLTKVQKDDQEENADAEKAAHSYEEYCGKSAEDSGLVIKTVDFLRDASYDACDYDDRKSVADALVVEELRCRPRN